MTLLELILTTGILLVLSTAAIPMFRITIQHRKESELRYDLREMRNAIDRYKDDADKNLIRTEVGSQNYPPDLQTLVDGVTVGAGGGGAGGISASALAGASNTTQFGSAGTPQLGAGQAGGTSPFGPGAAGGIPSIGSTGNAGLGMSGTPTKVRYLRKIPVDPMTGKPDWGLRSVQDDPDSTSWGGSNVFDVYSQSQATATDGTKYSDW
ncbi:MAG TPA: type II secretion system protein [Verrucomicrobiae bacterium]|nr:type II secretion system protein [Verrucomicrobiae bacterium]